MIAHRLMLRVRRSLAGAVAVAAGTGLFVSSASAVLVDDFDPPNPSATATQSGSAPGPQVTAGGPTGQFLRLVNDGVNSQVNHYSYALTDPGTYNTIVAEYDFRASSPGNAAADGFSFILAPTSVYGNSGVGPTGFTAEEPNIANTFAVGVDLHPAASVNDVSVHFGTEQRNVTVPTNLIDLDAGVFHGGAVLLQHVRGGAYAAVQLTSDVHGTPGTTIVPLAEWIPGLTPYENRVQFTGRTGGLNVDVDLDNIAVAYANVALPDATVQNFDDPGTPARFGQFGSSPGPIVRSGGPDGSFLRLTNDGINSQGNAITFAATEEGLNNASARINELVIGNLDFRATSDNGQAADGFSVLLLPTDTYGTDGQGAYTGQIPPEEPNLPDVLAFGVDFYPGGSNDVSVHWDGMELENVTLDPNVLQLDSGDFHHLRFEWMQVEDGSTASLYLTPDIFGTPGSEIAAFENVLIPGLDLYNYRLEIAGRTGGLNVSIDLDNINVAFAPVPEPMTATLGLMGLGMLAVRTRRRRMA